LQIKTKIVNCHTADSKPVKQEVNTFPFSVPWTNTQAYFALPLANRFFFVTEKRGQKARVHLAGWPFQPSVLIGSKARAYPS
jgi:hypothetical protein